MATDNITRTSRLSRWALPVLLTIAVASFVAAIVLPLPWKKTTPEPAPVDAFQVVPFALTERSGRPVSDADLKGKVWVASFVFTRCSGPCPSVTATVARLQSELDLANTPDLRLVTFTVDPDRDTPDELRKYADRYRAHPDHWLFLTGKEKEIHRLAKEGFKLGVSRSTDPNPPAGQEFDHSTRLVVIDKAGRVRSFFDGYQGPSDVDGSRFNAEFARLKETVAALLKE
ncbi:MAG TPA: SCO family protein [Fimbriiglobus sp.]|nr:SCO family protein [Fimbriiglobus sp.]